VRTGGRKNQPRSRGSAGSDGGLAPEEVERRYIRVPTERLDALMNLAGELVVGRSRMLSRVAFMRSFELEMGRSRRRLVDSVERFRSQNEFGLIEDNRKRSRAAVPEVKKDTAKPQSWAGFGELELDRYDDVHILARSLTEIASDLNEMDARLFRELSSFGEDTDAFGGIVSGIQSEVTRARMVPLGNLFTRLQLPIRDAAERDKKEVRTVMKGEDVDLDKTIADALFAPMLHLVRNAVGHGIESASARAEKGKPREGTITLLARQEAGQIVLEVSDDGNGLDLGALHARGVAMGLLPPETQVNDPAVKELVFATGLSTTTTASAVSGRGVGCDVVKRAVERMNGDVRVETTAGKGTTFVVTLPLTLAITRAVLVRKGNRSLAIPMYFAERILETSDSIVESAGKRRLKVDGNFVTVRGLEESFGEPPSSGGGPIILMRVGDQAVAVQVDAVVAEEEIVVKNLGQLLDGHPLIAGMTIRGAGELWLILDVPGVMEALAGDKVTRVQPRQSRAAHDFAEGTAETPIVETAAAGGTMEAVPAPEVPVRVLPFTPKTVAAPQPARAVRILFVDDSLSVRKVAEQTLKELGADVTLAVDGLDALTKLREGEFDLVFSDLEMPRMHGYELIRELRYIPTFQTLPIVVVSSRSGQKHQDQARALGATGYITKPFTSDQLKQVIDEWGPNRGKRS
jgi:chemosensory pili system protein ChpA (sensor histidine kinase/response regulator)